MNRLNYDNKLKKVHFNDIEFTPISTENVGEVVYDKQSTPEPDTASFKQLLLEVLSKEVDAVVVKYSILFTPKQPNYNGLGFLYLGDRTILPIKIQASENYLAWEKIVTKGNAFFKVDVMDWLVHYSKSDNKREGMSHEFNGKKYTIEDQELYTETGKYLHSNAPKKFNLKKIAKEKQSYLKKYVHLEDLNKTENSQKIANALLLFKQDLTPSKKETDALKKAFLALSDLELPAELVHLYDNCDGSKAPIKEGYSILSSKQFLNEWKAWKAIFDEWTLEELKANQSDQNKSLPLYITPYWFPFMTDSNGNFIGLDYAPGKKGTSGQIIAFGADESIIKVLADNMADFFEQL